jgi:hypothetical protein
MLIANGVLGALETLVEKYIANRGTEHEFIKCSTPDYIPAHWRNAELVIKYAKRKTEED